MTDIKKKLTPLLESILIHISPKLFNLLYYRIRVKRPCRLKPPHTFCEKVIWLKLYWRDPLAVTCADKYLVRQYLTDKGHSDLLIPMIGIYESVDEIPWDSLPERFVMKATHGSAWNLLCKDKNGLDLPKEQAAMRKWLRSNYYYRYAEWNYKDIKPRIICEEYMREDGKDDLTDYKIMCFGGEPHLIISYVGRFGNKAQYGIFDLEWNLQPCSYRGSYAKLQSPIPKPETLIQMIKIAKDLSQPFPCVRVDLYNINGKIYFGELTFFHGSGFKDFMPMEYELLYGNLICLPEVKQR